MVTGALTNRRQVQNMAAIDAWADAEITEAKLQPLMDGEIAASHDGTEGGEWLCWWEFSATGHNTNHRYKWFLLGSPTAIITVDGEPFTGRGSDITTRITGSGPERLGVLSDAAYYVLRRWGQWTGPLPNLPVAAPFGEIFRLWADNNINLSTPCSYS